MVSNASRAEAREAPTLSLLRAHRAEILQLASRRGVSNIRIFGSVARGDATGDSDIDLLVDFEVLESGLDLVAFAQDLEKLLGYPVDVGTEVHKVVRTKVARQAVPL